MKVCDYCKKEIRSLDYIQVTFMGRMQQIPSSFHKPLQLEFCSFTCFYEYFKFFVKEVSETRPSPM